MNRDAARRGPLDSRLLESPNLGWMLLPAARIRSSAVRRYFDVITVTCAFVALLLATAQVSIGAIVFAFMATGSAAAAAIMRRLAKTRRAP
jgi:amino acid permease